MYGFANTGSCIGVVSPVNGNAMLQGKIIDAITDLPLPGASVTIVDPSGTYLGEGVAADNTGEWFLNSTLFVGNKIRISHVGFKAGVFDPAELYPYSVIAMYRDSAGTELPPVVVTGKKKSNIGWWLIGGLAALFLLKK